MFYAWKVNVFLRLLQISGFATNQIHRLKYDDKGNLIGEVEFFFVAELLETRQTSEVDHRRWSAHKCDGVG